VNRHRWPDTFLALYVAFAIAKDELNHWEAHLVECGIVFEGGNNWERGGRATGIKVGPVFLLQLMTSFQIRVGETGGVHHVGHAVYYRLDRCCRTQPTRNHYRVHISRILKQGY
jgi:hypothetical protein